VIGKMISHYKILQEIGEGGLGVVYKAEDTKLRRTVALKFLKATALGSEEQKARFVREAQAAAALSHPGICTVHEIGDYEGRAFIAMAYIEGSGLDDLIRRGPLPIEEVLSIAVQVGEGLQEAHEQKIIHRDIKSGNIRITPKGRAKILDFGLARMAGQTVVTQEGVSMGTVAYMSPEQAKGETLDHRTDIWSFGVVLYEMLVGRLPFKGDNASAVIYSILNATPDHITGLRTGVPLEIERIVMKALAKDPRERYQHIDEMLVDLRALRKQYETGTIEITSVTTGPLGPPGGPSFKEIVTRRVPLIIGIYAVAAFALIYFAGYLVDRFPVSPDLPDVVLILLISLLPTVLFLAYSHGRPGAPKWSRSERIGIPINIVGSVLLLFIMFQGEPLATTTMVTTTDDQGRTVEVEIPRQEFRKRIAIFYFKNETGDSALDWIQYAVPHMLNYDLLQDIYIDLDLGLTRDLLAAGFSDAAGPPVALMRKIADRYHRSYFLGGTISGDSENLILTSTLYETGLTEPVGVRSFAGADLMALVDEITVELKRDIKIPTYHIEATADRALSEIFTDKRAALREYGLAKRSDIMADHEGEVRHLEAAVAADPTFALAQFDLSTGYWSLGKHVEATGPLMAAMQHIYKLPTWHKYLVRVTYHERTENEEAALQIAEDWARLYPQSISARDLLATFYMQIGELDKAIAEREKILELDPGRHNELIALGSLYAGKGEFEQGLVYLERYRDLYAEDYRSYSAIGDLYKAKGAYEEARSYYKRARRHAPDRIDLTTGLADLEVKLGNFEEARRQLTDVLVIAQGPRDRGAVYVALKDWHKTMGQIGKALEYFDLYLAEQAKYRSPLATVFEKLLAFELYAYTEDRSGALGVVEEFDVVFGEMPGLRFWSKWAKLWYYVLAEDRDHLPEAEALLAEIETFQEKGRSLGLEAMIMLGHGGILSLKGEYEQASELIAEAIPLFTIVPQDQRDSMRAAMLGEVLRKGGDPEGAETELLAGLRLEPSSPFFHSQLGLTYRDMGRDEEAFVHLRKAMEIWKDADPSFKPAREAREALSEMETNGVTSTH
jgi:serine/threonine protein kinase/tetratricopeptide (TPR) repeat protein